MSDIFNIPDDSGWMPDDTDSGSIPDDTSVEGGGEDVSDAHHDHDDAYDPHHGHDPAEHGHPDQHELDHDVQYGTGIAGATTAASDYHSDPYDDVGLSPWDDGTLPEKLSEALSAPNAVPPEGFLDRVLDALGL